MIYLAVGIGGFIGAVTRYLFQSYLKKVLPLTTIPLSVLIINLIGSFGLGLLIPKQNLFQTAWQLLLITGFLGAFTTFSSFSLDSVFLIEKHGYAKAFMYIFASIVGCIFLFFIGNIIVLSL